MFVYFGCTTIDSNPFQFWGERNNHRPFIGCWAIAKHFIKRWYKFVLRNDRFILPNLFGCNSRLVKSTPESTDLGDVHNIMRTCCTDSQLPSRCLCDSTWHACCVFICIYAVFWFYFKIDGSSVHWQLMSGT